MALPCFRCVGGLDLGEMAASDVDHVVYIDLEATGDRFDFAGDSPNLGFGWL